VTVGVKGPQATSIVTVARAAASQTGRDVTEDATEKVIDDAEEEADQSSDEAT